MLMEAFRDLLPAEVRARQQGFDVPVGEWFMAELSELFLQVTLEGGRGLLDPPEVVSLHREHASARGDHTERLCSPFALTWLAAGPYGPRG